MNVTYRRAVQAHVASALDDADVAELRRILGSSPRAVGARRRDAERDAVTVWGSPSAADLTLAERPPQTQEHP